MGSRVRNHKRMSESRVVFSFGVTYATSPETLSRIGAWVREIIESQDNVRFDRAHFKQFGASLLDFEVIYDVLDPSYNLYMDIQQAINLGICRRLVAERIRFAFPSQVVYLRRTNHSLLGKDVTAVAMGLETPNRPR